MQPWQHEFLCTMHTALLLKAYHTTTRITRGVGVRPLLQTQHMHAPWVRKQPRRTFFSLCSLGCLRALGSHWEGCRPLPRAPCWRTCARGYQLNHSAHASWGGASSRTQVNTVGPLGSLQRAYGMTVFTLKNSAGGKVGGWHARFYPPNTVRVVSVNARQA